jgi:hypothetical protein
MFEFKRLDVCHERMSRRDEFSLPSIPPVHQDEYLVELCWALPFTSTVHYGLGTIEHFRNQLSVYQAHTTAIANLENRHCSYHFPLLNQAEVCHPSR